MRFFPASFRTFLHPISFVVFALECTLIWFFAVTAESTSVSPNNVSSLALAAWAKRRRKKWREGAQLKTTCHIRKKCLLLQLINV